MKRKAKKAAKLRPTFREIYDASPIIQGNLAVVCTSLVLILLAFAGLAVYGLLLKWKLI